jgi:hypothetical protein
MAIGIAVLVSYYWSWRWWWDWQHFPLFIETRNVSWGDFYAQTAFVALFVAGIVNLRKPGSK